ncbi:MAG: HesA/MoeB/ThiF family protein [Alphaproteobacteria bacterium]
MDLLRYQKQIILPEINTKGQSKISEGKVLCVGAGGLGSPLLLYLAAAGVGTIGIIDGDNVDISNLQRQILFKTNDIGKNKAFCAKKTLNQLNPTITIHRYEEYLSSQNCIDLFKQYDVIVDGSDNFATKYLINDAAVKVGRPVVYASVIGFEGQVSIFDSHNNGPCYRCLYPTPPNIHINNCAEAGIIGSVVGILGTLQSLQTLYVLLGYDHCMQHSIISLLGKLLVYNLKNMESSIFNLQKNVACKTCSKTKEEIFINSTELSTCRSLNFELDFPNAKNFSGVILDVREENERANGFIPSSVHIPFSIITKNSKILHQFNKQNQCLVYCQSGIRSQQVAQIMNKLSFKHVYNLKGGYLTWLQT